MNEPLRSLAGSSVSIALPAQAWEPDFRSPESPTVVHVSSLSTGRKWECRQEVLEGFLASPSSQIYGL